MAQPPSQDLTSGVDFTALTAVTGSILNGSLTSLVPTPGSGSDGLGMVITTYDTAIGVPNVPSPALGGNGKWATYLWLRHPFVGDPAFTVPAYYSWDVNAASNATYLKWVNSGASFQTSITAQVNQLQTDLAATTDASTTALTNSSIALTTANAASNAATSASSLATAAQTSANTAITTANTASTNATNAVTTSNAANTTATNALAAANANINLSKIIAGASGQRIRVNAAGLACEYYYEINAYILLQEHQATTVNGANVNSGSWQDRVINTTVQDTGGKVLSLVTNAFTLAAGTYRINAKVPMTCNNINQQLHQARLFNTVTASSVLLGTCESDTAAGNAAYKSSSSSHINGTFTTDGTIAFKVQTWCGTTSPGGYATSFGGTEVYTSVEITQIG